MTITTSTTTPSKILPNKQASLLLVLPIFLTACGQTGALYLPSEQPATVNQQTATQSAQPLVSQPSQDPNDY